MSLQNNIDKIFQREDTIEKLLVNPSELKPLELAELSKELSDIKHITELAKKKYLLDKELSDLSELLDDKETDNEIKSIKTKYFLIQSFFMKMYLNIDTNIGLSFQINI